MSNYRHFPLWFSYAKEQADKVEGICSKLLSNHLESLVDTAISDSEGKNYQNLKHIRLTPLRYKKQNETDDGSRTQFRLALGEPIDKLTSEISSHMLRVMILSTDYFKSPHCMEELCMSLCSNHTEKEKYPALLLHDINTETTPLLEQEFEFVLDKSTNKVSKMKLTEALQTMHEKMTSEYFAQWTGYNLGESFRNDLPKTLGMVLNNLHATTEVSQEEMVINLYRFTYNILHNLSKTESIVDAFFTHWQENELAQNVLQKLGDANGSDFKKIANSSDGRDYLNKLHQALKDGPDFIQNTPKLYPCVSLLCGLVVLKSYGGFESGLLAHHGYSGALVKVELVSDNEADPASVFKAYMTFTLGYGHAPDNSEDILDRKTFNNISVIHREGIDSTELAVETALKDLCHSFLPFEDIPESFDKLKEDQTLIRQLRRGIQNVERHRKERNWKLLRGEEHGFIVLSESEHFNAGQSDVLTQLDSILNEGFNEKVRIPCVVMKVPSYWGTGSEAKMLVSEAVFDDVSIMLGRIAALFKPANTK